MGSHIARFSVFRIRTHRKLGSRLKSPHSNQSIIPTAINRKKFMAKSSIGTLKLDSKCHNNSRKIVIDSYCLVNEPRVWCERNRLTHRQLKYHTLKYPIIPLTRRPSKSLLKSKIAKCVGGFVLVHVDRK